jgi:hypothetical protein
MRRAFLSVVGAALVGLGLGFAPPTTSVAGGGTLKISPKVFSFGDVVVGAPCKPSVPPAAFAVVCTLTISAPASAAKPLYWYAEDEADAGGSGSGGIATFSPSAGYVKPGQAIKVKVTTSDCGIEAWFFFGNVQPNSFGMGVTAVIYGCG